MFLRILVVHTENNVMRISVVYTETSTHKGWGMKTRTTQITFSPRYNTGGTNHFKRLDPGAVANKRHGCIPFQIDHADLSQEFRATGRRWRELMDSFTKARWLIHLTCLSAELVAIWVLLEPGMNLPRADG